MRTEYPPIRNVMTKMKNVVKSKEKAWKKLKTY